MTRIKFFHGRLPPAAIAIATLTLAGCGGGGGSSNDPNPPPAVNKAPTADAGADQDAVEANTVTLSAAGSSDSDGNIVSYAWSQTDGDAVTLQGGDSVSASFDAPLTDVSLSMTFEVLITDDDGATATATTTVTVEPNVPPTVNAGMDSEAVEGETVVLDGTASDDDGSIAGFAWVQTGGPAVTLTATAAEDASFVAPEVATITQLEFQLTATDDTNDATSDSVTISVNPNEPPEIAVNFPCAGCRFFGDAIAVTGTVTAGTDNVYVASLDIVASVTVTAGSQSVDALVQDDGEWIAQNVPVSGTGSSFEITASATDSYGESTDRVISLELRPTLSGEFVSFDKTTANHAFLFDTQISGDRLLSVDFTTGDLTAITDGLIPAGATEQIVDIAVDQDATTVFLCDFNGAIETIDLNTGAIATLSDSTHGTGPALDTPMYLDIDDDSHRLVVFDTGLLSLLAVDTVTGNRTVLAANGGSAGSGPDFGTTVDMRIDALNDFAYVVVNSSTYLEVELATGDRSQLPYSGDSAGSLVAVAFDPLRSNLVLLSAFSHDVYSYTVSGGVNSLLSDESMMPAFQTGNPGQITVDTVADRYVINDFTRNLSNADTNALVSVDPDSGARSILLTDTLGSGPTPRGLVKVALDADTNALYVADENQNNVIRVDLASGNRVIVSDDTTGNGPDFSQLRDLALDTASNRAFVTDSDNARLFAVALDTGDRSIISDGIIGSGTAMVTPTVAQADFANDRVFVIDNGLQALLAVDLASGARTVISDSGNAGPVLLEAEGLALDNDNDRLLVTVNDNGSTANTRLLAIDIATGERTILSSTLVGNGPFLNSLRDVSLLDGGVFAAVGAEGAIYLVNLSTGNRQILVDPGTGNGEATYALPSLAYDAAHDVVYSWDSWFDAGFMVDIKTGDHVVISK